MLAFTSTLQSLYKWLVSKESECLEDMGGGIGYKQSWEVVAELWICPHKQVGVPGHLCNVTWKLSGKQPPGQDIGLSLLKDLPQSLKWGSADFCISV